MIPDWMPKEPWEAYIAMRKQMGKKYIATDYAQKLLINKLDGWRKEGQDVTAIIHQSIENSWQGLFPVKQMGFAVPDRRGEPRITKMEELPQVDRSLARHHLQVALNQSKIRH